MAHAKRIFEIDDDVIRISKPIILIEKIGMLIVDYSIENINTNTQNILVKVVMISILIVVISTIVGVYISQSISNPVLKIKKNIDNIAKGNLKNEKTTSKVCEINELSERVSELGTKLDAYQKELIKTERLTTIGEISARITHDLRNPLTVINTSLEIMKKKNPVVKNNMYYFDRIQDAALRMNHQIDEVLSFVKVKPPVKESVKFSWLLSETLKIINHSKNVKIIISDTDKEIWIDKFQMQNILLNLVSNAIQAIGSNEGNIKVDSETEDMFDKIIVTDSGEGIPENSLETIFEPLYATKQTGTGIGLVSCKNIVKAHSGKIYAQNSSTGGAVFTILLSHLN